MDDPLAGCYLKLQRADKHLVALHAEMQAFFDREPYSVAGHIEGEGTERVFRLRINEHPPAHLGPIIGDVLQNTRSALDHLAWQLAIASGPAAPSRDIYFPIVRDQANWDQTVRRLRALRPDMLAMLEGLQPYHSQHPDRHGLWLLNELARVDRHQTLHLVGGLHQYTTYTIGTRDTAGNFVICLFPCDEFYEEIVVGPFEDDAVLARFVCRPANPAMDVDCHFVFIIAFGQGTPAAGIPVCDVLSNILRYIGDGLLPRFHHFFPQAPSASPPGHSN